MPAVRPAPEWIAASVPKRGNRADENEDATAASADGLRFAVADGATEGWESGRWAARLAAAFVAGPPGPADFAGWLAAARDWAPPAADPEPWYVTVKQEQGSFATLAGLELRRPREAPGWAWRAVTVGDSCLFQIRDDQVELAVPLGSAGEFGNRPALVPSSTGLPCPPPGWFTGRARPGDLFLLATDAAAARLLGPAGPAAGLAAARAALAAGDGGPLADWCRGVQDATNDDVSVLAVRLHSAPEPP
ncbi:MAG TPA: hypothetical protein VH092_00885 [Urbifossiella sp.]|nr:hypothetical protein [Urbifossiella sp.]